MTLALWLLVVTALVTAEDFSDIGENTPELNEDQYVGEDTPEHPDTEEDLTEEWDPIDPDIQAAEECEGMIEAMYKQGNVITNDNLAEVALANASMVLETGDCGDLEYCKYIPRYKFQKLKRGCRTLLNQIPAEDDGVGSVEGVASATKVMLMGCGFAARAGRGGAIVCVERKVLTYDTVSAVCNKFIGILYDHDNIERNEALEAKAAEESRKLIDEKKCTKVDATRCRYMRNIDSYHIGKDECSYFIMGINPKKKKQVGCSFTHPANTGAITCIMRNDED